MREKGSLDVGKAAGWLFYLERGSKEGGISIFKDFVSLVCTKSLLKK